VSPAAVAAAEPIPVAIVGMGTVGTGVAQVLTQSPERITHRAGRPVVLKKAVVRDLSRDRGLTLPPGVLTTDLAEVIGDPSIRVAVHLVGGIEPARQILIDLLKAGKDVVTANKALLCEHGPELFGLARELGRTIAFEAAVAGGIPIIATMATCLTANQVQLIAAILNGTSNFILSQMAREGWSYDHALKQAQELGFAEADPTLDVDGTDAAQKLVLLTQLAYGVKVPLDSFPRRGIDTLDLADLKNAAEFGYVVKLVATARLSAGKLEMHVQPTLVGRDNPLASVHGSFNAIRVVGDVVGETWYSGRGAGQLPTASAVVADLIDTIVGRTRLTFERLEPWHDTARLPRQSADEVQSRFYIRLLVEDRPQVLAGICDVLGRNGISIASVIQHEAEPATKAGGTPVVPLVIMTHTAREGQLRAAEEAIAKLGTVRPGHCRMPVAD
jgi:homoserine dehydrogenase